jgi:putative tricarboxylic transport membrane protein
MRIHETLLGLLVMIVAAVFFGATFGFAPLPGQKVGPALFPQVIAVGAFICGLIIAARGRRSAGPWLTVDPALRDPRRLTSFLVMPASVAFYLIAAERLGFLPTAALIVGGLAWWFGVRPLRALALGVLAAWLVHWFFASAMRVPLPRGLFMHLVAGG